MQLPVEKWHNFTSKNGYIYQQGDMKILYPRSGKRNRDAKIILKWRRE
jgi:hypothetical protein